MHVKGPPSDVLIESEVLIAWGADSSGMIQWSTKAWRSFTGISSEQQSKHSWQTCLHPEDENVFHEHLPDEESHVSKPAIEFRLLHHDGTFRQVLGYVHYPQGQTSGENGLHAACFEIQTKTSSDREAVTATEKQGSQQDTPNHTDQINQAIEFDHQAIRDLFDNDVDSLRELAELFDATCKESLDFLATAFTNPNQQELFSVAHRLKGAIANVNSPQVLASCQQLEEAIDANDILTAEKICQQVIRYVAQLRNMVKEEFRS